MDKKSSLKTNFKAAYDWLLTGYPKLQVISGKLKNEPFIIEPGDSLPQYNVVAAEYQDGGKRYVFNPTEPFYFQSNIILYRKVKEGENISNLSNYEEGENVIEWINSTDSLPDFERCTCYGVECLSAMPYLRNVYELEGNASRLIAEYEITVRFYITNSAKKRVVVI